MYKLHQFSKKQLRGNKHFTWFLANISLLIKTKGISAKVYVLHSLRKKLFLKVFTVYQFAYSHVQGNKQFHRIQ